MNAVPPPANTLRIWRVLLAKAQPELARQRISFRLVLQELKLVLMEAADGPVAFRGESADGTLHEQDGRYVISVNAHLHPSKIQDVVVHELAHWVRMRFWNDSWHSAEMAALIKAMGYRGEAAFVIRKYRNSIEWVGEEVSRRRF